jgi:ribosomal protein L40E
MAKFQEAMARLFTNVFVCKKCKTKIRAQPQKVLKRKVKCRRCQSKALRSIKKVKSAK